MTNSSLSISNTSQRPQSTKLSGTNKNENSLLKYSSMNILGATTGYLIPLKNIDGPDVVSGSRGGMLVLMKTKVPNTLGKYKNALIGCFVGTLLAGIYDYVKNRTAKNQNIKHQN